MTITIDSIVEFSRKAKGNRLFVTAVVTKVNKSSFNCTEMKGSREPGKAWRIQLDDHFRIVCKPK